MADNVAADELLVLIERIEALKEQIRDVYDEAETLGYEVKTMRQILKLRKMDPGERREMEMILHTYKSALGLL